MSSLVSRKQDRQRHQKAPFDRATLEIVEVTGKGDGSSRAVELLEGQRDSPSAFSNGQAARTSDRRHLEGITRFTGDQFIGRRDHIQLSTDDSLSEHIRGIVISESVARKLKLKSRQLTTLHSNACHKTMTTLRLHLSFNVSISAQ